MKEPPIKMSSPPSSSLTRSALPSLLLSALLLVSLSGAAAAPEPARFGDNSGATGYSSPTGFVSNPAIYSYSIANQNKSQQQQQAQTTLNNDVYSSSSNNNNNHQYSNNNNNNNNNNRNSNLINFAANANYRSSSSSSGTSSRNFYYTNSNSNSAQLSVKDTTSAALPSYSVSPSSYSSAYSSPTTFAAASTSTPTQPPPITSGCTLDRLAVYKVVLHTYWTRDLFPKHYPDWRPTAQWTKTLGRTHDGAYALYHLGQQATPGVKQFAESGKTDILDSVTGEQQQQKYAGAGAGSSSGVGSSFASFVSASTSSSSSMGGGKTPDRSVFDEFNIPAIGNGAGRSEAKFFVDSNHSFVSLMTRIVPSPDWFIGVDSFQLCVGGSWIDTVTVEMDPLDAGTDNGFTFTAPNWPTSPQGVIYRITSRYPAHPAGSFFYPKSKRLPPIATFQFIKLKEYELSEVFNFAEDDRKYETVKTQTHLETEHNHVEMNNELSASIERERQNEISPEPTSVSERDRIRSQLLAKLNPQYNTSAAASGAGALSRAVPKNDKNALMQNIVNSYRSRSQEQQGVTTMVRGTSLTSSSSSSSASTSTSKTSKRRRTKLRPRDCRVSHWSEWSQCSKTCGIGEMQRFRKVIKHGKRGGRPCPALQESKWCGSEKGCHAPSAYFNWSNT